MKQVMIAALALSLVSCAKNAPSGLTPIGVRTWQANEVAVGLGILQSAAIALNGVERCDEATPPICQKLLSDDNTRVVVEGVTDGLNGLRAVPSGWKSTGLAVITRIQLRLDAAGLQKMSAYLDAAKTVINMLVA